MVMYFRDFGPVRTQKSALSFRILTVLDMFTAYYNPANAEHTLTVAFDSIKDLNQIHKAVQTGLQACKAS